MVDMILRFRLKDGPHAGSLTRGYGGLWNCDANRGAGAYDGFYDQNGRWVGVDGGDPGPEPGPGRIHLVDVSHQQWPYIWDFNHVEIMAEGARRSGKSFALAPKAAICALYNPHKKGGLLGPTYRQIANVWSHILKVIPRHWLLPGTMGRNDTKRVLRFINGTEIILLHAHNDDASRSEGVAWWGIDERQDVGEGAWTNALLSTSEGGDHFHLFETATIKESLREHHEKLEADPDCAIYRMSMPGNPFISRKLYAFASKMLDQDARDRELDAKWPQLHGRCYYQFDEAAHVRDVLLGADGKPLEDITAEYCAGKFGGDPWGPNAARHIIGVDPPRHASVYKVYRGENGLAIFHQVGEVVAGLDGGDGDIRDLSRQCWARYPGGWVIRDPHDTKSGVQERGRKGSHDADLYFQRAGGRQGYRVAPCPYVGVNYQLSAVNGRLERGALYLSSNCVHTIECYKRQTRNDVGKPDKSIKSKITPTMTIDHAGDMTRYPIYRCFPTDIVRDQGEYDDKGRLSKDGYAVLEGKLG